MGEIQKKYFLFVPEIRNIILIAVINEPTMI